MQKDAKLFWTEIVCCGCAKSVAGRFVADKIPVRKMTAEANRSGFVFSKQGRRDLPGVWDWECQRCQSKPYKP